MSIKLQYIFRAGELFLSETNTLPFEIPETLSHLIIDSLDLTLSGSPAHAVLLSGSVPEGPSSDKWVKLRSLLASTDPLEAGLASAATRALGLLNWHSSHRFCTRCGTPYIDHPKDIARLCPACKAIVYPRLSPAVIVLVQKEGKILLARHTERNQDTFSCIAGYIEHGETLEECVIREVAEETGLLVHNIQYAGSQSWPYPDQYMIGFYADWKSGEIRVEPEELLEACWFDRDHLPNYPMPGTVAWRLINGFLSLSSKK